MLYFSNEIAHFFFQTSNTSFLAVFIFYFLQRTQNFMIYNLVKNSVQITEDKRYVSFPDMRKNKSVICMFHRIIFKKFLFVGDFL